MQKLWDKKAELIYEVLDGKVRLVGGCVRDWLQHKPFEDRDMATPLLPDEVIKKLSAAGIRYRDQGKAFGTIVAIVEGTPFEITTLRKDIQTDGRHAVVGFTKSWATDARRRDFTVNALYADKNEKVYDYVGGIEDLKAGRLRFVGQPLKRMQEDYLRLLRYFRFFAKMNAKAPEEDVIKALPQIIPHLKELSVDRRRDELFKIISGSRAQKVLTLMKKLGVLTPDLTEISFSKKQVKIIKERSLEKMLAKFGVSGYKKENDK